MKIEKGPGTKRSPYMVCVYMTFDELAMITALAGATNDMDHPGSWCVYRPLVKFCEKNGIAVTGS